jgi:hypothetical protein
MSAKSGATRYEQHGAAAIVGEGWTANPVRGSRRTTVARTGEGRRSFGTGNALAGANRSMDFVGKGTTGGAIMVMAQLHTCRTRSLRTQKILPRMERQPIMRQHRCQDTGKAVSGSWALGRYVSHRADARRLPKRTVIVPYWPTLKKTPNEKPRSFGSDSERTNPLGQNVRSELERTVLPVRVVRRAACRLGVCVPCFGVEFPWPRVRVV